MNQKIQRIDNIYNNFQKNKYETLEQLLENKKQETLKEMQQGKFVSPLYRDDLESTFDVKI